MSVRCVGVEEEKDQDFKDMRSLIRLHGDLFVKTHSLLKRLNGSKKEDLIYAIHRTWGLV